MRSLAHRLRSLPLLAAALAALPVLAAPPKKPAAPKPVVRRLPRPPGTYVTLQTSLGDVVIRMLPEEAPQTVANFVGLAEGKKSFVDPHSPPGQPLRVRRPFYDGLTFHRALPNVMLQAGCPKGDGTGGPGYTIPDELPPRRPYLRGAVLMSRRPRPNSAGSQFLILLADLRESLPKQYVVFGAVVEGLDVADRISRQPVRPNSYRPTERSTPVNPVVIKKAIVTRVK